MGWALDFDDPTSGFSLDSLNSGNQKGFSAKVTSATVSSNAATLGIFWTPCLPPGSQQCPPGFRPLAYGHGKVFDADLGHLTGEGCHGKTFPYQHLSHVTQEMTV